MNLNAGYAFLICSLLPGCGGAPAPAPEKAPAPVKEQPKELPASPKPGMVMFRLKRAPLRGEVLPQFEAQAGVRIKWTGSEREVTIRMTHPMEWREALELVCQFTGTHVATDYQGRLILKNGYGGTLTSDNALLEEERRRQNRDLRETSGATTAGQTGENRPSTSQPDRETVENTRGSGNQTETGVKYNEGRKPGSIFDSIGGVTHH